MTKEEKIKEAWAVCSIPKTLEQLTGHYWFRCKRSQVEYLKDEFDFIIWDLNECSIRPKSLKGIEHNNGWIKIESEEDVPDEVGLYFTYSKTTWYPYYRIDLFSGRLRNSFENGKSCFTHYQPIEKPKPPIY